MISFPTFGGRQSGGGGGALDVPVAALAGLAVAFAAFAMPADLLEGLVRSSGVAALVPAAEPPLGLRARIGLGAAGAVPVFALVFLLLRWLDRRGARREAAPEVEEAPRLRRRDFHPDAPPRPPLSARDLGEPEPEPAAPEPLLRPRPGRAGRIAAEAPVAAPAPEPPPELAPGLGLAPEPAPELELVPELAPAPAPAPPAAAPIGSSIPELMARLEHGLARRRAAAPPPPAADPPARAEPADDRLQSAIDSLQRLAARHH